MWVHLIFFFMKIRLLSIAIQVGVHRNKVEDTTLGKGLDLKVVVEIVFLIAMNK